MPNTKTKQTVGEKMCKCGHSEFQHNFGGKYACLVNYNEDGCLRFELVTNQTKLLCKKHHISKSFPEDSRECVECGTGRINETNQPKSSSEGWEDEYQKIMHAWFKRVVMLELDGDLVGRVRGTKPGFWTIRNYQLEDFIRNLLKKHDEQIIKEVNQMETIALPGSLNWKTDIYVRRDDVITNIRKGV